MSDEAMASGNGQDEIPTSAELAMRRLKDAEVEARQARMAHEVVLAAYLATPPIRPLYDRVLILADPEKGKIGSIVVADAHKERPLIGTVVAVGEGRLLEDGSVKPLTLGLGDRVVYGHYSGLDIPKTLELGDNLKVLREDEILGRV